MAHEYAGVAAADALFCGKMPFLKSQRKAAPGQTSDPDAARIAAIALLSRRDFATPELRGKLICQGYTADATAQALDVLTEERLLDDARYAENYVAAHSRRGQGPARIAAELKAIGVGADLIEAALAAGPDWHSLAREARARKFGAEPPEDWREKARQARFLQYRGFSSDHIRSALGTDFDPD